MSTSGIGFSGIGTGLDTESIIQQLLRVQQRPITILQNRKAEIEQQQAAIAQLSVLAVGLQSSAGALAASAGFAGVTASSSNKDAVDVTAGPGAQAGAHTVEVLALARRQRIAGAAFTSQTDPIGLGAPAQIVVNGKTIAFEAGESLQSLAAKINLAKAGVSASIVSETTGSFRLVLSSTDTGIENVMRLSDVGSGTVLATTLGLVSGSMTSETSELFTDSATSVATLLGQSIPSQGTFTINGHAVAVDFGADSLSAIAIKINAVAGIGVTASVETVKDPATGVDRSRLRIAGAAAATVSDPGNLLANLGIVRNTAANQVEAAADASFRLNGLTVTRASNTVTDALAGVTIALKDATGNRSSDVTIAADLQGIRGSIQSMVDSFNQLVQKAADLMAFDPQTYRAAPLFGDSNAQNLVDSLTDIMTTRVDGLSGPYSALGGLGITLDQTGRLVVRESELTHALETDLASVARLFQAVGMATNTQVAYVSSTQATRPSPPSGYAIEITRAAERASVLGGTPASGAPSETLTFTGGEFGTLGRIVTIAAGSTLADVVAMINADTFTSPLITASQEGGLLRLLSTRYGSAVTFTVRSSQALATSASGIGSTPLTGAGTDVAGTIGGEAATGTGQFLTGDTANTRTAGLQLRIDATAPGSLGLLHFTKGIGALVSQFAKGATDVIGGSLTTHTTELTEQTRQIDDQIARFRETLASEEERLRRQFTAMESAVIRIQSATASITRIGIT
ncbi:MAG TPA: flagellar filament capping protein FliD [Chthonomonadales bacterium]|nr:flagellar filament capping protein FliD [Chthonomonadales bacterium]